MDFNISPGMKDQVGTIVAAPWGMCVKCLEVWLVDSLDSTMLMELNFTPVLKSVLFNIIKFAPWVKNC